MAGLQGIDFNADRYTWIVRQVELLRAGQPESLDADNLAAEIERLAGEVRLRARCALVVVCWQLLKHQFLPEPCSNRLRLILLEHRHQLRADFQESPSLEEQCRATLGEAYQEARIYAAVETGLPEETFRERCPFTWEQVLDDDFFAS
ncbi:MAG: DUF29 domain-containing protein [Magnetococcales bacterium]|nr:DUF29 domain-containing protein [Magnetococcales bacterium]